MAGRVAALFDPGALHLGPFLATDRLPGAAGPGQMDTEAQPHMQGRAHGHCPTRHLVSLRGCSREWRRVGSLILAP